MNQDNDQSVAHQAADVVDEVAEGLRSAAHSIGGRVQSTARTVQQAAGRAVSAVGDTYGDASRYARDSFDRTRARARSWERSFETSVRENPKTSLIIAAAFGAVLATLWKRR
jgi:ElaB/YqjD/DUF883 family membrane-anchored ribosome-binding protein